jgi:hypothetical protein
MHRIRTIADGSNGQGPQPPSWVAWAFHDCRLYSPRDSCQECRCGVFPWSCGTTVAKVRSTRYGTPAGAWLPPGFRINADAQHLPLRTCPSWFVVPHSCGWGTPPCPKPFRINAGLQTRPRWFVPPHSCSIRAAARVGGTLKRDGRASTHRRSQVLALQQLKPQTRRMSRRGAESAFRSAAASPPWAGATPLCLRAARSPGSNHPR